MGLAKIWIPTILYKSPRIQSTFISNNGSHWGDFACKPIRTGIPFALHTIVLMGITWYEFVITFTLIHRPIQMFWNVQNICRGPENWNLFVLHRWTLYELRHFILVHISSLYISINLLWICTDMVLLGWCDLIRCNMMHNNGVHHIVFHRFVLVIINTN